MTGYELDKYKRELNQHGRDEVKVKSIRDNQTDGGNKGEYQT